jgi:hypothetical protein
MELLKGIFGSRVVTEDETTNYDDKFPRAWNKIFWMLLIGLLSLVGIALYHRCELSEDCHIDSRQLLGTLGSMFAIAGAFYAIGFLAGFIFGVPRKRMIQNGAINSPEPEKDNIVEISDWVTKIIVGVGLTELKNIPGFIHKIATYLAPNFGGDTFGVNNAAGVLLFFTATGFMSGYQYAKTYYTRMIESTNAYVEKIKKDREMAQKQVEQLQGTLDKTTAIINNDSINKQTNIFSEYDSTDNKASNIDARKLEELKIKVHQKLQEKEALKPLDPSDIQKGRWSQKASANGYRLHAKVTDLNTGLFELQIYVTRDGGIPVLEPYAIFIHDTFQLPGNVAYVVPTENTPGMLKLITYEAFTIGALMSDGTELELDLNDRNLGYPRKFYY